MKLFNELITKYFRKKLQTVRLAKLEDLSTLAEIHSTVFKRSWSENELASLYMKEHICTYVCTQISWFSQSQITGFILVRQIDSEAEILTFAISPEHQHQGIGENLLLTMLRNLYNERTETVFLEVNSNNKAAMSLYKKTGFKVISQRENYYQSDENNGKAFVMRFDFS